MNIILRILSLAIFTIVFISLISSCGDSKSTTSSSDPYASLEVGDPPPVPIGKDIDIETIFRQKGENLGVACELLTDADIAEAVGKTREEILLSDASPQGAGRNTTACFYKWDDFDIAGAGVMIQLLKNPLGDDFPDYVTQYILQKRTRGEQGYEEDAQPTFYQQMDWGDDGSFEVGTSNYFWRLGDAVVFQIAFNTGHSPKEQYQIATKLATKLTENFVKS